MSSSPSVSSRAVHVTRLVLQSRVTRLAACVVSGVMLTLLMATLLLQWMSVVRLRERISASARQSELLTGNINLVESQLRVAQAELDREAAEIAKLAGDRAQLEQVQAELTTRAKLLREQQDRFESLRQDIASTIQNASEQYARVQKIAR